MSEAAARRRFTVTSGVGDQGSTSRSGEAVDGLMHLIADAIEVAGVGIIVISALVAAGLFLR